MHFKICVYKYIYIYKYIKLSLPCWPVGINYLSDYFCEALLNMDKTCTEPDSGSEYTEVWNDILIQLFVCFFQCLFSLFCSSHDGHLDLFWDLNFVCQFVMWYIISNIQAWQGR